ncbi:MAG TPA: MarR family winged helix-turn-helix transcriptional regulator [Nitrososphaerales archaeon]|nr:MarR family winged helix-turn-helix transcriptional regulator [Nitrososphaerales archaeon]
MSTIGGLFRRLFGVERIGNITLKHLSVLVYLAKTPKDSRASSAEKLEEELDLAEGTITRAFGSLYDSKFIDLLPEQKDSNPHDVRDPKAFFVTPLGRRALRPFLGTFDFITVATLTGFTFIFGVIFGTLYTSGQYPNYSLPLEIVGVFLIAVMAASFYGVLSIGSRWQKIVVPVALRKKRKET